MSKTFLFQVIQFNQTVLIQTIQFTIEHRFYSTYKQDPIRCYHSMPKWAWELRIWRGTPHCSSSSIISRTLVDGVILLHVLNIQKRPKESPYMTTYKTHVCIRRTPISTGQIQNILMISKIICKWYSVGYINVAWFWLIKSWLHETKKIMKEKEHKIMKNLNWKVRKQNKNKV